MEFLFSGARIQTIKNMASASMGELRQALKACLEERGVLSEVRATVRSNIFKCLDESGHSKPPPSERTSLMNQLIAEYLSFNGYRYSSPPTSAQYRTCSPRVRS